jgi:type IV secretion system protein VirD4
MSGTKILWGQMLAALCSVLIGIWLATEWTAWRLAYQPALGLPWLTISGIPVYRPELFFGWWYQFEAYAPAIFLEGAAFAVSGGLAAAAVAIAGSVLRARQANQVTTYGSARWATEAEIRAAGLFDRAGIELGR